MDFYEKITAPLPFSCLHPGSFGSWMREKAAAPKIEPVQYPGWIEVKLDPDARFSVPSVFFEETEAIRKKMEAEETDPYVKALLEKDRAQYSKKEASSL